MIPELRQILGFLQTPATFKKFGLKLIADADIPKGTAFSETAQYAMLVQRDVWDCLGAFRATLKKFEAEQGPQLNALGLSAGRTLIAGKFAQAVKEISDSPRMAAVRQRLRAAAAELAAPAPTAAGPHDGAILQQLLAMPERQRRQVVANDREVLAAVLRLPAFLQGQVAPPDQIQALARAAARAAKPDAAKIVDGLLPFVVEVERTILQVEQEADRDAGLDWAPPLERPEMPDRLKYLLDVAPVAELNKMPPLRTGQQALVVPSEAAV